MSTLHERSKVCMAPLHVRIEVCITPIYDYVRSKVCQFALHMYGSYADFALHMERSHADFATHIEWKHSFRDQHMAKITISGNFQKYFCQTPNIWPMWPFLRIKKNILRESTFKESYFVSKSASIILDKVLAPVLLFEIALSKSWSSCTLISSPRAKRPFLNRDCSKLPH